MAFRALFSNNIALSSRMIHLRSARRPLFGEVRRETDVGEKREEFFLQEEHFPRLKTEEGGAKGDEGLGGKVGEGVFFTNSGKTGRVEVGFGEDSVTRFEEVSTAKDH